LGEQVTTNRCWRSVLIEAVVSPATYKKGIYKKMSETRGNNFVAIGASNRLTIEQVKLLQQAVDNEVRNTVRGAEKVEMGYDTAKVAQLDQMGNDLMVIASKMEAGE
jgi:hypothetical protein